MEIIPLIKLKRQQITDDTISLDIITKEIKEGEKIYILDSDGIEENKQNLLFYQKLSSSYDLLVDSGPRNLGDVMDVFMTGAAGVIIRRKLCPKLKLFDVKELSENKIYVNIDFENQSRFIDDDIFLSESDGAINFNSREKIEQDPRYSEYFNKIKLKNKVYCYESDPKNRIFWEQFGASGLIVDMTKIKEFKDGF